MSWRGRYSPEPLNSSSGMLEQVDERIREMLNSSATFGSYAPASIPQSAVSLPVVTDLPQAAGEGDQILLVADATIGAVWHFVNMPSISSTYPWHFIGGSPLLSVETGATTRSTSTYGDLASGASTIFTLALAGDYRIEVGANLAPSAAGFGMFASFSVAGATALDADAAQGYYGTGTSPGQSSNSNIAYKTGLAAGTTIQQKFKMQGTVAGNIDRRFITITPVRVGRA